MQSEGGYTDYIEHGGHVPGAQDALTGASGAAGNFGSGAGSGKGGQSGKTVQSAKQASTGGAAEWKASRPKKKKLSYSQQREYDGIEAEIEALEEKSKELESQMELAATDYPKLAELSREKEEVDRQLEEKMERFIELQDLVDSFEE
jgi:ATP-binding cassette subfamily F protein uup